MSSIEFGVEIRPDPLTRRLVWSAGLLALVAGYWLIFTLQIALAWRMLLALVWTADCCWSLWHLKSGAARVGRLRLDMTGNVLILGAGPAREPARLMSGSVVLPGLAWLRLRLRDGSRYAELLIRPRTDARAWHRLQLIWHQCRDSFGSGGRA